MFKKFCCLIFLFSFLSSCIPDKASNKNNLDYYDNLIKNVATLPIDYKIAQMLLVGFSGYEVNKEVTEYIKKYNIGGIILFSRALPKEREANIKNPAQLKKLVTDLQNISDIKLFIAVDQEGGKVARLNTKNGFHESISAGTLGNANNLTETYDEALKTATLLNEYGININFAPVVDVNINLNNPVIAKYERSFSSNEKVVIQHAKEVVKAHRALGIITTLKHFPGHGSSKTDSHLGFVDITDTYVDKELTPYRVLIKENMADGILSAHVINKKIDPKYPASLSKQFLHTILREELNYKGLIFSDDMKMSAIEDNWTLEQALVLSINAGTDVVIYGNNLGQYNSNFVKDAISMIRKNVENSSIKIEKINESFIRIIEAKKKLLQK